MTPEKPQPMEPRKPRSAKAASPPPARRSLSRRWRILLILFAVLAILGFLGIRFYPRWNKSRLTARARTFVEQRQFMQASLSLRRVLAMDPNNVPAIELVVQMSEALSTRETLSWRHRLMELRPDKLDNRYDLADLALFLQSTSIAEEALTGIPEVAQKTARFHFLTGKIALAKSDYGSAETHYAVAAKLDPSSSFYRFELAALRVLHGSLEVKREARPELDRLAQEPKLFSKAMRVLVADAVSYGDLDRAMGMAERIRDNAAATFDDKLVALGAARLVKSPKFTVYLTQLQEQASTDPQQLYSLLTWLSRNGNAMLAVEWSRRLPAEVLNKMPAPMGVAFAYAALGDWPGLEPIVAQAPAVTLEAGLEKPKDTDAPKPTWGEFEFMRLGLAARALLEQGSENESRVQWGKAVAAAGTRLESLKLLARAADDWGWNNESTDLLWTIARDRSEARWALDLINYKYGASGNTRGLLRVAKRRLEVDPADLNCKNNVASFSLLVESDPSEGLRLAQTLHSQAPENPIYTSTYAFALHLQGKTEEAITLMKTLGPEQLERPAFAAYFGIMLASVGSKEEAQRYLGLAKDAKFLPEEQKLMADARSRSSR